MINKTNLLIDQLKNRLKNNYDGHLTIDECIILNDTIEHLESLDNFVEEWSDRFGFLATVHPRDSFKSIDEVATILYNKCDDCNYKDD